jgi:hypothetical protein
VAQIRAAAFKSFLIGEEMKITDDSLALINEAIKKQLEDAGKDIADAVPEVEKLLEAIKKEKSNK